MMSFEERIIQFTAERLRVPTDNVKLSSRLYHDLRLDGDDAVQFFREYRREFGVDLSQLRANWRQHFGLEGGAAAIIVPLLVCAGFSMLLVEPAPILVIALLIGIVDGFPVLWNRYVLNRVAPIAVADLVRNAETGRWVKASETSP